MPSIVAKNGYNNINDSKDERRPSQIKSQKTMPREILDDIKDYQEEESESLRAVQKQLKLFCALVAFCFLLFSYQFCIDNLYVHTF